LRKGEIGANSYTKGDYEDFCGFETAKKQTQFKAKQTQSVLAPRPALGVEKLFEKTNPILKWAK